MASKKEKMMAMLGKAMEKPKKSKKALPWSSQNKDKKGSK